eukprot:gene18803-24570_t
MLGHKKKSPLTDPLAQERDAKPAASSAVAGYMKTLLVLHGAIGAAVQMGPLADALRAHYHVHVLDFSGHGGRVIGDAPFSIELFARDVLSYMEFHGLARVSVFGYSMGGYVGMYLARHHADRVERVMTLATKYWWDEAVAAKEVLMLNPDKIVAKLPVYAGTLMQRHEPQDWKQALHKTADMMLAMGAHNPLSMDDYAQIDKPCLILMGDRDKMVTLEETLQVYKAVPGAQLGILPGVPHPIEQVLHVLVEKLLGLQGWYGGKCGIVLQAVFEIIDCFVGDSQLRFFVGAGRYADVL